MFQCCFKLLNITSYFQETLREATDAKGVNSFLIQRFAECWWKLSFCLVFILWMSEFRLYMLLLSITNNRSDSMYCGGNGNIFKFLNKSLQESLFLLFVIILIALLHFEDFGFVFKISKILLQSRFRFCFYI
jgi:hypothetical protein